MAMTETEITRIITLCEKADTTEKSVLALQLLEEAVDAEATPEGACVNVATVMAVMFGKLGARGVPRETVIELAVQMQRMGVTP